MMGAMDSLVAAAGGPVGTITFVGQAGDSANLTTYNITLACGDGGDMVIGTMGTQAGATITAWTIGGRTVTEKVSVISASENTVALGTANGVGPGNQTMSITYSGSQLRCITFGWVVTFIDIFVPASTDTDTSSSFAPTIPTIPADGVGVAYAGTGSGDGFEGSTGLSFDGNQLNESNAAGASDAFSTLQTNLAVTFTGASSSQPAAVGMGLAPARATVKQTHVATNASSLTTYNFTTVAIGEEDSARQIAVAAFDQGGGARTDGIASITVNDVLITNINSLVTNDHTQAELWSGVVPLGTSVNLDVVFTDSADKCKIIVWSIYGAEIAVHDNKTDTAQGTDAATNTLDIPARGVAVAGNINRATSGNTTTYAGLTESVDETFAGNITCAAAEDRFSALQSGLTISSTPSISILDAVITMASWGPTTAIPIVTTSLSHIGETLIGGGDAALDDGNEDKAHGSCAQTGNNTLWWAGWNMLSAKAITRVRIVASNSRAFKENAGGGDLTFQVRGHTSSPAAATDGTLIASIVGPNVNSTVIDIAFAAQSFQYVWVTMVSSDSGTSQVAQLVFDEAA